LGTLSFLYPGGVKNWPRNYVVGFALPPVVENVIMTSGSLQFEQFVVGNHWTIPYLGDFFPPNSNVYSTDGWFDPAGCEFTHLGVPTLNQLNMFIGYPPGQTELFICIATEFGFEPANYRLLGENDHPWPPRSPY